MGFAKKIPLGFWKEKIPELNTGPSMSLQVEWQGLSVGRIHREQVHVWEFMQGNSLELAFAPPWGRTASSSAREGVGSPCGRLGRGGR